MCSMIRFARTTIIRPAPIPSGQPRRAQSTILIEQLANLMREMECSGETVSFETLAMRGWRPVVIEQYFEQARALARRQSIKRIKAA